MRTLVGLALLLIVGLLFGASLLVYAAYVMFAVFWISRYLTQRWTQALVATRTVSAQQIDVEQTISVQLRIDNRDSWSVFWVLLEEILPAAALLGPPPALKVEGSPLRLSNVPAHSSRVMSYRIQGLRRGYFPIGPAVAETGDLLGLHRRFRTLAEPFYLLVLPKLIPLDGYDVASRRPVGEVKVSYRLLEDSTMISGIRKYQTGDPLRSIHWRATARTGQLQSKQYQPTSVAGANLVLDMHVESNPDHHEPVRTDLAVTAAASICHTLLQVQQQFGVVSNGRDAVDRLAQRTPLLKSQSQEFESIAAARSSVVMRRKSERLRPVVLPAARGPEHFTQCHQTLARLERTDGLPLEDLLIETQSRLARDATVFVILQEVTETAALALGLLVRQGYSVAAIVNNYENDAFEIALSRLLAQRIAVYHLLNEESIPSICKDLVLRY
ncbi:DUF58 domain-containing protein [Aureliella helgolandensis]|uniref:DUF58 domain-containing protein n=1 Tax=Aureliella helgolandensis TaxID=2527968 RepID=A0A518G5A4_9BACT|nr:DUF58 domain-containing protein [Aureliella helgolandensis]QDV23777.1 hypothetical protein Q31a_20820 [Aureliella helgolandensis]